MLELLLKYQIFAAGCLGFCGVIATIFANGFFSRRQHSRELRSTKDSIRLALASELEVNLSSYEARIGQLNKPVSVNAHIPVAVFSDVYDNLLAQIGLLDPEVVRKVITAYLLIKEVSCLMEFYGESDKKGFVVICPENRASTSALHQERIKAITEAIKGLKNV